MRDVYARQKLAESPKEQAPKSASKRIKKQRIRRRLSLLVIIPLLAVGLYGVYSFINSKQSKTIQTAKAPVRFTEPAKKGVLKNFTGPEFRDLYNSFAYPNTKRIAEDTPITSNPDADARIRKIAEDRGYHIRSAPVTDAFREVAPGMKLQERAADPWLQMVEAAKKDKETLILTAAYRSADEQKKILLDRLGSDGINIALIGRGIYDQRINEVLRTTAVPGYSRHHTGYTIDIGCQNDPSVIFDESSCFKWLSADNYKNAKTFGWIPSYPPGAGNQGPEPESWEYVWVGVDTLTE